MEKHKIIYELIIKFIYFIFSIIASVFVVKNIISFITIYNVNVVDEADFYGIIGKTHIGKIFNDIGGYIAIDGNIVSKTLLSFINNIEIIAIIFLIMTILLALLYFVFTNWRLVSSYLKLSFISIGLYLIKYILYGLCILVFFKDSYPSLALALNIANSLYMIICLLQLFVFSLWIIKFLFNILSDVKSYINY